MYYEAHNQFVFPSEGKQTWVVNIVINSVRLNDDFDDEHTGRFASSHSRNRSGHASVPRRWSARRATIIYPKTLI
ncbi:uncharacterized protein LOC125764009 isoform X2 [Anopheles funestus]|uniref:uncharacterized protein LOC125764009 isoform X2 n=1 Tax=Anopheles funestus TaxID=62324 RepID=UPI0020C67B3B|nr:uncharacterized protein LOC125764009 isoform X2 [Anopheles funestus]